MTVNLPEHIIKYIIETYVSFPPYLLSHKHREKLNEKKRYFGIHQIDKLEDKVIYNLLMVLHGIKGKHHVYVLDENAKQLWENHYSSEMSIINYEGLPCVLGSTKTDEIHVLNKKQQKGSNPVFKWAERFFLQTTLNLSTGLKKLNIKIPCVRLPNEIGFNKRRNEKITINVLENMNNYPKMTSNTPKYEIINWFHPEPKIEWRSVECNEDMGPNNPRQLCGKTYCANC